MDTHRAALLFLFFLPPFFHACNATAAGLRQPKWRRELETYSGSGLYETRYFTQTLDHFNFNPQSYAKFQQRYLVNHTYWGGKGSPIFVYTGNEGRIELFAKNTGFMFDIAPSFKALLVFIEVSTILQDDAGHRCIEWSHLFLANAASVLWGIHSFRRRRCGLQQR